MEKLISVIIPAYNAQKTIERCVKSICGNNIEIIIVVDGATDDTLKICKNIDNNNLKVIEQSNMGAFEARRTGIENSTGKYIMFLDSDDYYASNVITRIEKCINKYNEPDLIRFRYKKIPNGYEQYKYFNEDEMQVTKEKFKEYVYPMFLNGYMLNAVWTNCVKRDILKNVNFGRTNIKYGEDLLLNLEIFSNIENVVFINDILYNYTYQENSITNSRTLNSILNNIKDAVEVYSLLHKYLLKWDMYTEENVNVVNNRIKKETNIIIELLRDLK